jgi:hypothetical protein
MKRACAENVIAVLAGDVRNAANGRLPNDHHHPFDIVRGETPVSSGHQVPDPERRLDSTSSESVDMIDHFPG